jgi:hypothetical protein
MDHWNARQIWRGPRGSVLGIVSGFRERGIQPARSVAAPQRTCAHPPCRAMRALILACECRNAAGPSLKNSGIGMAGEEAGKKGRVIMP